MEMLRPRSIHQYKRKVSRKRHERSDADAAPATSAAAPSASPSAASAPAPVSAPAVARPLAGVAEPLSLRKDEKKKKATQKEEETVDQQQREQEERDEDGAAVAASDDDDDNGGVEDAEEEEESGDSGLVATTMDGGAPRVVADEEPGPAPESAPEPEPEPAAAFARTEFEEPFQLVSELRAHLDAEAAASSRAPPVVAFSDLEQVRRHSPAVLSAVVAGVGVLGRVLPDAATAVQLRSLLDAAPPGLLMPVHAIVEADADGSAVMLVRRSLLEAPESGSASVGDAGAPATPLTLHDALQAPHALSSCFQAGASFRPVLAALLQYVQCARFLVQHGAAFAAGGVRQLPWLAQADAGAGRVQLPASALLLLHPTHQSHLYERGASAQALDALSQERQRARYLSPETVRSGLFDEPAEVWCVGVTMWEAAHAGTHHATAHAHALAHGHAVPEPSLYRSTTPRDSVAVG